jgi:TP901 family phage tail tape measure protein
MPTRNYQVNYDITATTSEAVRGFQNLVSPIRQFAEQVEAARKSMQELKNAANEFKQTFSSFKVTPIVDTRSFADALATMEANVKASSMRMRASLESALSGSAKDHRRINDMLGTGNWKTAMSERESDLKQLQQKIRLLNAVNDKYSKSEKARLRGEAAVKEFADAGIDYNQRAADYFKKAGLGNILTKSDGAWKLAGGDTKTRINDYIKGLEAESANLNRLLEDAKAKNAKKFGDVASKTAFNKGAGFLERTLGVSPEMLKEIQPALNAINSMVNGVQQTQERISNVVKKVPVKKPVADKKMLSNSGFHKLIKEQQNLNEQYKNATGSIKNPFAEKVELLKRILEQRKKKNLATKSVEDELRRNIGARDAYNENLTENYDPDAIKNIDKKLVDVKKKIEDAKKLRNDYAQKLKEWRKNPTKEVVEQITTSANGAKAATSKPFNISISGNFKGQIESLQKLSAALASIPKAPIDIAINVKIPDGTVASLNSIKTSLSSINSTRARMSKAKFSGLDKIAEAAKKYDESTQKKKTATTKIAVDGSTAVAEFDTVLKTLQEKGGKAPIILKTVIDTKGLSGSLTTAISGLKKTSQKSSLTIKAKLQTTGISKQLTSKISALRKQITKSNLTIKAKYDGVGLSTKLREQIKALKSTATKNPITLKAKFDTTTIKNDLNKLFTGLSKTTLKSMPTIKVTLDTTGAVEKLNSLLLKIKAASPQNIMLGATTSQPTKSSTSTAPVVTKQPKGTGSRIGEYTGMAASTASMSRMSQANRPGIVDRLRKHMYPLTGNVSLGASTPVALDMAKGMGVMYGVGGAMNLVTGGLTEAMEYQNTMETAKAILKNGYHGKNFDYDYNSMANEVRSVAKRTKFTAPQAADATRFMAMAGLQIPDIKASVSPIADVAVIGDNDFGEVADKITNIQTAFKLRPNQMRHMADALTNTFTKTNTDMMMLAESMQYAAPMAHMAGMDLNDTLAMVGIMGNSGIQASMAGTTLRMMMQNTLNPNKKQAALWKKLGVATRDKSGNLRNMIDILSDVEDAVVAKKLPMADVVSNLFRVTASAGAGSIMENIAGVKKLAAQNRMASGISEEISLEKQNTVKGLWAQMTSAFTEANLKVFEQFQNDIKDMIKAVRDYFSSREAIENLKSAFSMLKDLMSLFGAFAKIWMEVYNRFSGVIKVVVATQFALSQVGLLTKPIMSLVNVFGGLKNLALDFVGALSGGAALKKAAVTASVIGAVTNGVSASNYTSRTTMLKRLGPSAQTAAYLSAYTPYSVYTAKMDELSKKKMLYEMKGNRLRNSIQKPGSLAREAVNPFIFTGLSAFNPNNKEDVKHLNEFMQNKQAMSKIYMAHPHQRKAMQMAYAKVDAINAEMRNLQSDNLLRNKKLSRARTYDQLSNIGLLYRYNRRYPGVDNEATRRYAEYRKMRREDQIANLALMTRLRYSSFYHKGNIPVVDKYFAQRNKELEMASKARRMRQVRNNALMYRAARLKRSGGSLLKYGFKYGKENALSLAAIGGSISGFFKSLRSGFFSVIGSLAKFAGMLASPIGLTVSAITALGTAAYIAHKKFKEQAEATERLTNKLVTNTYSTSNMGVIDYGNKGHKSTYFDIPSVGNSLKVQKRNKKYSVAWDSRLFKPDPKTGAVANAELGVNAWRNAFIEPNKELFGKDYKLFSKESMLKNVNELRNRLKSNPNRKSFESPNNRQWQEANKKDLANSQSLFQLSTLYMEGANSRKAAGIRDKIIGLREKLSNGKLSNEKYMEAAMGIMSRNGLTEDAINKIPRFTGNPNTLTKQADWSKFQQYHIGMYNQLMAEIRGEQNTLSGYYAGIDKLKSGVRKYSSEWWNAIHHVIGGMQTTIDAAGHAVQIKFDPTSGLIQWQNVVNQIRKFNKTFKDTMYNYLKIMGQAYGEMVNNGLVGNYYKDWRKFYMEQNKHRVVSKADARYFYSKVKGYSGQRLEDEVNNGLWTMNGGAGGTERMTIRNTLAVMRADEAKRAHDKSMKAIKNQQKAFNNAANGSSSTGGGTYNSPLADDAKNVNDHLGRNRYAGVNARPTQINITMDKLVNFDKFQFLDADKQKIVDLVVAAIAEGWANTATMASALASNDKREYGYNG